MGRVGPSVTHSTTAPTSMQLLSQGRPLTRRSLLLEHSLLHQSPLNLRTFLVAGETQAQPVSDLLAPLAFGVLDNKVVRAKGLHRCKEIIDDGLVPARMSVGQTVCTSLTDRLKLFLYVSLVDVRRLNHVAERRSPQQKDESRILMSRLRLVWPRECPSPRDFARGRCCTPGAAARSGVPCPPGQSELETVPESRWIKISFPSVAWPTERTSMLRSEVAWQPSFWTTSA